MRAYAILVVEKNGEVRLSQEAYSNLEDAHRFIKSRVPEPGRLSMMKFRDSEGREYLIHDLRVVETNGKRKFWSVSQKYFDNGRVKVNISPVEAETKPESKMTENKMCDEYVDYFDTYEEAAAGAEQARKA